MARNLQALASVSYEKLQKIVERDGEIDSSRWSQNASGFYYLQEKIKNTLLLSGYNWSGAIEPVLYEYVDTEILDEHWKYM